MKQEHVVGKPKAKAGSDLWDSIRTLIYAILIAVGIRTFAYEPFHIPSASMYPTLLIGDYVFVSKFSYGYSKYSLLFSPPLFHGRILATPPKRGDVVVFRFPQNPSIDYIKRLIGLPGDTVQMKDGLLYINGKPVERQRVADFEQRDRYGNVISRTKQWQETLPNGVTYRTLDLYNFSPEDNTGVFTVPPGHYFMMGDNRDNSEDSRVPVADGGVGFVPAENLVGRADVRWISIEPDASLFKPWTWLGAFRWGRMFTAIH